MPRGTPTTEMRKKPSISLGVERHQAPDSYLPPVWVTYIAHRNVWVLMADYKVEVRWTDSLGNDCSAELIIPYGFEFDLASIPRPVWSLIAPFELSIVAPLVHDWLYIHNGDINRQACIDGRWIVERKISRKDVDNIFLELMEAEKVTIWKRYLAYKAVRMFAWAPWNRYKESTYV